MFRLLRHNRGQSILEYGVILGIVALALGMMQVYLRRGIQAGIKVAADEIGLQQDSVVDYDPVKGKINIQKSLVHSTSSATRQIQHGPGGSRTVNVQEESKASGKSKYWSNWEEKD